MWSPSGTQPWGQAIMSGVTLSAAQFTARIHTKGMSGVTLVLYSKHWVLQVSHWVLQASHWVLHCYRVTETAGCFRNWCRIGQDRQGLFLIDEHPDPNKNTWCLPISHRLKVSEFLDITKVRKTLCLTTKALFLTLRAPELSGHLLKRIKCNVLAIAVTCPDRPLVLTQTHGAVSHISDEHEYSKIKYLK